VFIKRLTVWSSERQTNQCLPILFLPYSI